MNSIELAYLDAGLDLDYDATDVELAQLHEAMDEQAADLEAARLAASLRKAGQLW